MTDETEPQKPQYLGDAFAALAAAMDEADDFERSDLAPEFFDAPHPTGEGGPLAGEGEEKPDDPLADDADRFSVDDLLRCVAEPLNDTGNGARLLHYYGRNLLHVRDIGWHSFVGTHWLREGGDEIVTRKAQRVAARIVLEADKLAATPAEQRAIDAAVDAEYSLEGLRKVDTPTDAQRQEMRRLERLIEAGEFAAGELLKRQNKRRAFAQSSGNTSRITGMIAQALPHRTVTTEALDADAYKINVANGTISFEQVDDPDGSEANGFKAWRAVLRPHDRADQIAKLSPVVYDPAAQCPKWIAFLDRFQPNTAIRKFLQCYHGYAFTGATGEQCLVFNHGLGANGKSTFVDAISRLMGDYALTLSFESLAGDGARRGDQASPDLARLPGARLVRASEPERGVNFKESLLKSLTGGEPMLVRHLHKGFFEFRPTFKLVLSGNHKPEIGGVDHGIWRRMRLVPWSVTIPDAERRPIEDVLAEFWEERSGILNWLIDGALMYLRDGLVVPAEIAEATNDYREEMDTVGGFVADCVEVVPLADDQKPAIVAAREMYEAFQAWCEHNAARAWKEKTFASAMIEKGFARKRTETGRIYLNVRLKNVPSAPRRAGANEPPHPADEEIPV